MASTTETRHNKNVANFSTILTVFAVFTSRTTFRSSTFFTRVIGSKTHGDSTKYQT